MSGSDRIPLIVITMAGLGSRFRAAGYTVPKFQVEAHGHTLFAWSIHSLRGFLDAGAEVVFVAREADEAGGFIDDQARALRIAAHRLVHVRELTDGQATSALLGLDGVEDNRPLVVYNIDTLVEPPAFDAAHMRGDGWIPCFAGVGDAWSFVRADEEGRVLEVREKQRISEHATLGLYAFGSVGQYRMLYDEHFSEAGGMEHGERYIAPMYNRLVQAGGEVWMTSVDPALVHPLGTPDEVDAFTSAPAPGSHP